MALSEKLHHSACRTDLFREEVVEHVQYSAPRGQRTASGREPELFDVFEEELGGGRPSPRRGAASEKHLHNASQFVETSVPVQILADETLLKIVHPARHEGSRDGGRPSLLDLIPQRRGLWEPQSAEELGAVPKVSLQDCRVVRQTSSWESMVLEQVETSKKVRRTARIARPDSASSSCVAWFRQENEARQTRLRDRDRRRFLGGEV